MESKILFVPKNIKERKILTKIIFSYLGYKVEIFKNQILIFMLFYLSIIKLK